MVPIVCSVIVALNLVRYKTLASFCIVQLISYAKYELVVEHSKERTIAILHAFSGCLEGELLVACGSHR